MAGYLHFFRIQEGDRPRGPRVSEYQVNYASGTKTFTRTLDETDLGEFLTEHASLDANALDQVMEALRNTGQATVGNIEIPESNTSALGLQQITS